MVQGPKGIGFRNAPKIVTRGVPNGGGGGGNAQFDEQDTCSAPQTQQSDNYYSQYPQSQKKKKKSDEQCQLDDKAFYDLPQFGPIIEGSIVPVESLLGTSSGLKSQYKNVKKDSIASKQAAEAIRKLSDGTLKIGDKNVKKLRGMKTVFEVKADDVRVYFRMDGDIVQIIAPCFKKVQTKSIKLLKKYFK